MYEKSSRFSEANSTIAQVKKLVAEAVAKGNHFKTNGGQYFIHHAFDDVIGTDFKGKKSKILEVQLDADGNVKNAYPINKEKAKL